METSRLKIFSRYYVFIAFLKVHCKQKLLKLVSGKHVKSTHIYKFII